jgi:hypothetical protein
MSDYDDELQEIFASVKMTKRILTKTLATVKFNLTHSDEDASNDTFAALVDMLRRLRVENNMCIETLCEEAMQDE